MVERADVLDVNTQSEILDRLVPDIELATTGSVSSLPQVYVLLLTT